jgi:uncharacterized protein
MSDESWQRDGLESPCINICMIHPEAQICTGCHRTIEEIAGWSAMGPEERRRVMAALPGRGGWLKKRRGGRAARLRR